MDLVTEVDEQAEQVIRDDLSWELSPPTGCWLRREGKQTGEEDARWIVDPLDGTTNYAHGLSLFCVSVVLERAGEVVLGVVHDPIQRGNLRRRAWRRCHPERRAYQSVGYRRADPGAYCNRLPLRPRLRYPRPYSLSHASRPPPKG